MALSDPRLIFGIHSISPYRTSTGAYYGTMLVLGGGNLELTGEQEQLFGGSNKYSWGTENKTISTQFTATVKQYEDFMFEIFLGATVNTTAAESTAGVSTITNFSGTSVVSATVGIASVAITSGDHADAKFGKVMVLGTATANEVDIYYSTDIDFATGTDETFTNDALLVTAGVVIPNTGGTIAVADLGIEFTGGSGTIAITDGDSAYFYVRPVHTGSSEIIIGKSGATFPEFGALMYAAKRSDFSMMEIEMHKATGVGMPIALQETTWSTADISVTANYDSTLDRVFTLRALNASA
jgi:hypothetical protein